MLNELSKRFVFSDSESELLNVAWRGLAKHLTPGIGVAPGGSAGSPAGAEGGNGSRNDTAELHPRATYLQAQDS